MEQPEIYTLQCKIPFVQRFPRYLDVVTRQFFIFTLIGAFGTITHFVVLTVLVELFSLNAVTGSAIGAIFGALVNYLLNYWLTFRSTKPHSETFPRFLAVATTGFALNALIMYFAVELIQAYYLLAQVLATGTVLLWNYVFHKLWTFSEEVA